MSKLKKAIERAGKRESTPMGFTRVEQAKRRAMLLAVSVADDKGAAAAAKAGADVVFVSNDDTSATAAALKAAGDLPSGAVVSELSTERAARLAEAGSDFIASPFATTAATAVDTNRTGHVISLNGDHDDATLRALGPLGLDALLVDRGPEALTLQQQASFVRIAQLTSTPLLFRVAPSIGVDELRVLRDSGGAGVVLPAGATASDIQALGDRLREVPDIRKREGGASDMAVLPTFGGGGHGHDDDEEDEPDDE